ncbi:GAF domain-containing sensor histidine kinase [Halovenus marina]|uniref:GAF domain-containing sensor histidine kinase n=1 Tax=Halovenus marina TaxID=3396621 RepID=UPI003F56EB23
MSQESVDWVQARRDLYDVLQRDCSFEETAEHALAVGEQYLGVENGHLTRIEPDSEYWKATASTDPEDGQFPPGLILDLKTTYCRRTVAQGESIALHDAPDQGWEDDPAFETHELYCYHGTPVFLDDEVYGTVCFVSTGPRDRPFTDDETLFAELIARTLEHELQRQQTEAKIERLDQFASVLSHDLRNPLNVAQLRVDLAQDADSEHLAIASSALDRMESLITDVLTMARQGQHVEETTEVSLAAIAANCWESVATADANLVVEEDLQFRADPERVQQLFENLFRNSKEHGGTDITVWLGPLSDGDGFYVEDDGPGIPDAKSEEIFEVGCSTGDDGLGIGLAIVEGIASAHDWTVRVTDGREGGARFEVSNVVVSNSP